jgi:hypothetical protein
MLQNAVHVVTIMRATIPASFQPVDCAPNE